MTRLRRRHPAAALLLAALLTSAPAPVVAQTPAPPAGPPLAVRFTLPNGIVVLVAERAVLPIVTVRVSVGAGAVLDPADKAGLGNLTAALLPRGTTARTGPDIDRAIEFVGGSLEAEGGRDTATLALSVLRRDMTLGLDLLADVLLHPVFPAEEFERKRAEIQAVVRRSEEDPESVAGRAFRRLAFPNHPYGQPITGTEESLARLTRDDVAGFYAGAYRPQTTVVAVVGAVKVADVRAALTARLGSWPSTPPRLTPPGKAPLGTPARIEMIERDLTQATVLLGQATVTRPHPDYFPLTVASQILGGGSSSRLYTRIREERGLAYSVYADYAASRHGAMILVGFQSENARVREVLALTREELVRLRRDRVTDEELGRAKAYLVGSFPLRMDTNAELAALLIAIEELGLGLDYPTRYRAAVEAVTGDDVLRAARTYWDPDAMSLVVVAKLKDAGLGTP